MNSTTTRIAWALIGALYIALFILLAHEIIGKDYQAYRAGAEITATEYEKVDLYISARDLIAQWAMAVGTMLLFGLTLLSLRSANRAATDALNASTMALNAFKDTERGRLYFRYEEDKELEIRSGHVELNYSFTNVGRTALVVTGYNFEIDLLEEVPTELIVGDEGDDTWDDWSFYILKESETIWSIRTGMDDPNVLNIGHGCHPLSNQDVEDVRSGKKTLFFHGWVTCETVHGYKYRQYVGLECSGTYWGRIKLAAHNVERPLNRKKDTR